MGDASPAGKQISGALMNEVFRLDVLFLLLAAPCVGSFLGVLVERLPVGRPALWDRSTCPYCGWRLALRDLIPLLGWLANRGRCRNCDARLGAFYPAIELLALLVALWSLAVVPGWAAWATCALGWVLLVLAVLDWRHLMLPNALTLPLIPAGLAVAWGLAPERLGDHAIGAAAGFAFLALVAGIYRRLRGREGIGLGDAKLFAAAGAWVGWQGLPSVLLVAALVGLAGALVRARLDGRLDPEQELPFGPYLAGGLWLAWLYGPFGFA